MFYKCNYLCNGSFLASVVLVLQVLLFGTDEEVTFFFVLVVPFAILNEDEGRLKKSLRDNSIAGSDLVQGFELVTRRIIYEGQVIRERGMNLEYLRQVHGQGSWVDLGFYKIGLMGFLFLKNEGFEGFLGLS